MDFSGDPTLDIETEPDEAPPSVDEKPDEEPTEEEPEGPAPEDKKGPKVTVDYDTGIR